MPRPIRKRKIGYIPNAKIFKPVGVPMKELEEIIVNLEELEALRLKDLEGLDQEEAAGRMDISRPTFQRILKNIYGKMADALINGKAIKLEGGNYIYEKKALCKKCSKGLNEDEEEFCPKCDEDRDN